MRTRVPILLLALVPALIGCSGDPSSDQDPTGGSASPVSGPEGVLVWLHEGTGGWPPDLWARPLAGAEQSPVDLSAFDLAAVELDWSPDLSHVVWLERVPDGVPGARLVLSNPDGSGAVGVAELRHPEDYRGRAWSPDGSRFAFASYSDAGAELRVVDAETGRTSVIRRWDIAVPVDVDWSPDATRLVVAVGEGPDAGIATIGPDGSAEERISDRVAWRVRWSPDGSAIALGSNDHPGPAGIYVMAPDGSGERRLSPPDVVESTPVWSPDGAWIAFASEREAEDPPAPGAPRDQPLIDAGVYVMRADGSDVREVVAPIARGWPEVWQWFASWPPASR